MEYTQTVPCTQCPFLKKNAKHYGMAKLRRFASGEFPCHKSADLVESDDGASEFQATNDSVHCAGALIFLEKRESPHQMMRIAERLGMYDAATLLANKEVVTSVA